MWNKIKSIMLLVFKYSIFLIIYLVLKIIWNIFNPLKKVTSSNELNIKESIKEKTETKAEGTLEIEKPIIKEVFRNKKMKDIIKDLNK